MGIAKILVPLNGTAKDAIALGTAFALAKTHGAYVDAMFVHPDSREAIPITDMPLSPEIVQTLVDAADNAHKAASKRAKEAFSLAAAEWDARIVGAPEKTTGITSMYREVTGHMPDRLHYEAPLADIVVFPPFDADDVSRLHPAFVDVLTHCGRPVLLCSGQVPRSLGKSVIIGWDGRSAAAQALVAAIPVLEKAHDVRFARVKSDSGADHPLREAKEYLALHGVDAGDTLISTPKHSVAEELLETASVGGNDLLVVGGYGHSRLVEGIFGGTTDFLTSHATIPMLMAH
jgi:nucleotide-binding universal stress UspA family protein